MSTTTGADAVPASSSAARPLRVAVIGAGAVGAVLGGRLASVGAEVTFVARGATLAALREHGLVLESAQGDVRLPPGHAADAADAPDAIGPVDVVLVAVKAAQVPQVAQTLAPLVGPGTVVVPLQNGVEASGQLAAAVDPSHVAEGLCRMLAEQTGPGRVRHVGDAPSVTFGARAAHTLGAAPDATLGRLADAFRSAGVVVDTPADTTAALWEKFLFVEPLGAVGAAARATFGELLGDPETSAALEACVREVLAVGRGHGAVLADDLPARMWERYVRLPAAGTTSMQRDLVAGRPSELEAQTGAVVRLGRARGVPTPVHDTLYAVLRPQEARAVR
jgi:2-dehydropantoate 2-reductase